MNVSKILILKLAADDITVILVTKVSVLIEETF